MIHSGSLKGFEIAEVQRPHCFLLQCLLIQELVIPALQAVCYESLKVSLRPHNTIGAAHVPTLSASDCESVILDTMERLAVI